MTKAKLIGIFILFAAITSCSTHYVKQSKDSISFYYNNDDADKVLFFSDKNRFAGKMFEKKDGYWIYSTYKSSELDEIKFFYKVDGRVYLPECEMKTKDDFGGKLCILEF